MEQSVVKPMKPLFYKRYVDDTYVRRKKGVTDDLFEALNNHHENLRFTVEKNPSTFLDSNIIRLPNGKTNFKVVNKETKLPFHWSSQVPLQYKRSVIRGELHRAYRIATVFDNEIKRIRHKYRNAGYPARFVNAQINKFTESREKDDNIIPVWLFDDQPSISETKTKLFIKVPYCAKNETILKKVVRNLKNFMNGKVEIVYT